MHSKRQRAQNNQRGISHVNQFGKAQKRVKNRETTKCYFLIRAPSCRIYFRYFFMTQYLTRNFILLSMHLCHIRLLLNIVSESNLLPGLHCDTINILKSSQFCLKCIGRVRDTTTTEMGVDTTTTPSVFVATTGVIVATTSVDTATKLVSLKTTHFQGKFEQNCISSEQLQMYSEGLMVLA